MWSSWLPLPKVSVQMPESYWEIHLLSSRSKPILSSWEDLRRHPLQYTPYYKAGRSTTASLMHYKQIYPSWIVSCLPINGIEFPVFRYSHPKIHMYTDICSNKIY